MRLLLFTFLSMLSSTYLPVQLAGKAHLKWSELPPIPDKHGFAGSFAGVSNGALLVAGGANFPDGGAPWTGSKKAWSDKIFVLETPGGKWKEAGKLPLPLGYGVSVVWNNQLICIGGSNEGGHYKEVFGISYQHGKISLTRYPDLPETVANTCGAIAGNVIYVAGGLIKPDDKQAAHNFWALNLNKPISELAWKTLPAWPGQERMLSVAATHGKDFYLFSGAALISNSKGETGRRYLKDAFKYNHFKGWERITDMPYATVAAASPAISKNNELLIFGGDDGVLAPEASALKENHPGFRREILAYSINQHKWAVSDAIPTNKKPDSVLNPNNSVWAAVTLTSVEWHGSLVFPGGEVRPAVRTPRVLQATWVKVK